MLCSSVLFQHTWHSYKSITAIIVYEHSVSSTAHWSLWEGFPLTSLGTESASLRVFDQPVTATKFPRIPLCGRGDSFCWTFGRVWVAGWHCRSSSLLVSSPPLQPALAPAAWQDRGRFVLLGLTGSCNCWKSWNGRVGMLHKGMGVTAEAWLQNQGIIKVWKHLQDHWIHQLT